MANPLSSASYVRLLCAESGHWWSDGIWRAKKRNDGSTCLERTQHCERDGCKRTRKKQITPKTNLPIGQYQYDGELQKLGRVYRDELYAEQQLRQIGMQ